MPTPRSGPVVKLDVEACRAYVISLEQQYGALKSLSVLADPAFNKGALIDKKLILNAAIPVDLRSYLDDPDCGICGVDVPKGLHDNPTSDAVFGGIIAAGINAQLMNPVLDVRNRTPFSLHNASAENEETLRELGLKYYSPEQRLGFHTDGLLNGSSIGVPALVSIYNLLIAYRKPGNFYWIPFNCWNDMSIYVDAIGIGTEFEFELTPIVYGGAEKVDVLTEQNLRAPIFKEASDGRIVVFLNGEVVGASTPEVWDRLRTIIQDLKASLLANPERIAIPIKNRRAFILNNQLGFHARDVFEEPIVGAKYTRSFMRTVSQEEVKISQRA